MKTDPKPTAFEEPARSIPIVADYDVVVCGGGTAGCPAAIGAAQRGAKTLLLEKSAFLGGVPVQSLNPAWHRANITHTGLLSKLILEVYRRSQWDENPFESTEPIILDPHVLRSVLTDWVLDAGATVQLHTWVVAAYRENDGCIILITESKSGREAIRTRVVIDATGDADVAVKLGADFTQGDPEDEGYTQGMTVRFTAGNIDFARYLDFLEDNRDAYAPQMDAGKFARVRDRVARGLPFHLTANLNELFKQHVGAHDSLPVKAYFNGASYQPREFNVNGTMVHELDGSDIRDLTQAEILCRKQIDQMLAFMRKRVPGWEDATLAEVAPHVGVRESRCIVGDYTLTERDAREGRRFADQLNLDRTGFDMHARKRYFNDIPGVMMGIPLRAMIVKGIDNVLVAGRCISADHMAQSSVRIMHTCFHSGFAVGLLSAHCLENGIPLRELPPATIRRELLAAGHDPEAQHVPSEAIKPSFNEFAFGKSG